MNNDALPFAIVSLVSLVATAIFGNRRRRSWPVPLLYAGVLLRIVGSISAYFVIMEQYRGVADAVRYYQNGLGFAEKLWSGDVVGFFGGLFAGERLWGTPVVDWFSGLVLAAIGPSMRTEFLIFGLFALLGLVAMITAVVRSEPRAMANRYAAFVLLWPSLFFWTSIVGKEALLIFAVGITVLGYKNRDGQSNWFLMVLGIVTAFVFRPHVAFVLVSGLFVAHFLRPSVSVSWARVGQLGAIAVATWIVYFGMSRLFVPESESSRDLSEFVEMRAENTLRGGSSLQETPLQQSRPWLALPNVWLRPLPWEVRNAVSAIAAAEVFLLWLFVLLFHKRVWFNLRHWRHNDLLRFGLPVLVIYSLMLGLVVGNVGIIVRQRTVVLPIAFLFLVAGSARRPSPTSQLFQPADRWRSG